MKSLESDFKELKILYKNSLRLVEKEIAAGKNIMPPKDKVLTSVEGFESFTEIKVIILGQDPYINPKEANGMSFSVDRGVVIPPSLKNIFKELKNDLNISIPSHGDLSNWRRQGVLLLNTVLTVELHKKKSHSKIMGWEKFSEKFIRILNDHFENKVFIFWGSDAKEFYHLIDQKKHLLLTAAHPSPLSANRGFFGCKHFSKTNKYLSNLGLKEINWSL